MTDKRFFDYDEIIYYFNNYDESKIQELSGDQLKSQIESIKRGVILGDIPNEITDLYFVDSLEEIGYLKSFVDQSKFGDISKIFTEKSAKENVATACINIYRDILIFRRQNKIIGTAKICFDCADSQIKGTNRNTDNFGQDGDYEILRKVLRK